MSGMVFESTPKLPPAPLKDAAATNPDSVDEPGIKREGSKSSSPPPRKGNAVLGLTNFFDTEEYNVRGSDDEPLRPLNGTFLEDLEEYKASYNPDCPCEVADPDLQDDLLKPTYDGLPPLPNRSVIARYTRSDSGNQDTKGGRLIFGGWAQAIKDCTSITISNALTFVQSELFFNPARASPAIITVRSTRDGSLNKRLNIGNHVAIAVSCGMCMSSRITQPVKTSGPYPREHKYIMLMHHNQDWERWAAFMCLCFGQPYLYAEMTDLAIQLGTIKKVPDADTGRAEVPTNIHPGMMTPRSAGRPSSPSKYSVKYALSSDDNVPVYDATNQDVDFSVDLARLTRFPKWKGEIPGGSFIVTGYSASTYQTSVVKQGPKEEHVSCNLLWIIVCGIPKRT